MKDTPIPSTRVTHAASPFPRGDSLSGGSKLEESHISVGTISNGEDGSTRSVPQAGARQGRDPVRVPKLRRDRLVRFGRVPRVWLRGNRNLRLLTVPFCRITAISTAFCARVRLRTNSIESPTQTPPYRQTVRPGSAEGGCVGVQGVRGTSASSGRDTDDRCRERRLESIHAMETSPPTASAATVRSRVPLRCSTAWKR